MNFSSLRNEFDSYSKNNQRTNNTNRFGIAKANPFTFNQNSQIDDNNVFASQTMTNSLEFNNSHPWAITPVMDYMLQGGKLTDTSVIDDYDNAINDVYSPETADIDLSSYTKERDGITNNEIERLEAQKEQVQNNDLEPAQTSLSEAQEKLNSVKSGKDSELAGLKDDVDAKYAEYQEKLNAEDPKLSEEVEKNRAEIEETQGKINEVDQIITTKESELATAESNLASATSEKESAQATLSSLQGVDTSEMDDSQKESLKGKIAAAKAAVEAAKEKENQAKQDKMQAETSLRGAKERKSRLEEQLAQMETRKEELEAKVEKAGENNPEVQQALDAYNHAEQKYESRKTELTSTEQNKVNEAQSTVTNAQSSIDEIDSQISAAKDKAVTKEYRKSQLPGTYNLNDVEYDTLLDSEELKDFEAQIQSAQAGNMWDHPDMCLSFAYTYGSWMDGTSNVDITASDAGNQAANYPDASQYVKYSGSKESVLAEVKSELDEGKPVVLHVNGDVDGTERHYVTVVGYKSSAGDTLKESDLLILDTYEGKIEGMGNPGNRFMITGYDTGRTGSEGYEYQIYKKRKQ